MDLTMLAQEFIQEPSKFIADLGHWMQQCRWAGLSGLKYPEDYSISIKFSQDFTIPSSTEHFVMLWMQVTKQNPSQHQDFCVIFSIIDLTKATREGHAYPVSALFTPSTSQGQWAFLLAPLNPAFASALLNDHLQYPIAIGKDLVLWYIPMESHKHDEVTVKDLKILGNGDTTNALVKVTIEAGNSPQVLVCKSYVHQVDDNIESEVITQLHEVGFKATASLQGALTCKWNGKTYTLMLVTDFVNNESDGGKPFWDHLQQYLSTNGTPASQTTVLQRIQSLAHDVGNTTRAFHMALAQSRSPKFQPEKTSPADVEVWYSELREKLGNVSDLCTQRAGKLFPTLLPAITNYVIQALNRLQQSTRARPLLEVDLVPTKQRIHGDMHLGQFLYKPGKPGFQFFVTDLEGDPQLPPTRRREKRTVWFDLSGLLRALDYISFFGTLEALKKMVPRHSWNAEDLFACFFTTLTGIAVPGDLDAIRSDWDHIIQKAIAWAEFVGQQILHGYGVKETLQSRQSTTFKFIRATSELNYELGYRNQNALVPLLGVITAGNAWVLQDK